MARVLLLLAFFVGWAPPVWAQGPLFTFAQISDAQPETPEHQSRFQQVLDTIVAAGSPGALIPLPVDFVLFAGDLVSDGETPASWVEFVQTIDATLTAQGIPYRAVPGNHDQEEVGIGNYEFFIGDSRVWDTDSATVYGHNGQVVYTGWSGLRIIGFNNSNGAWNQISSEDLAEISARVLAAEAAGENVYLLGHHPHDEFGQVPLAAVLESSSVCCHGRGHSGSPGARRGLDLVANPDLWDLNTNSTFEDGAILYFEVYATELRVHVIELYTDPTELPAPRIITLAHPLQPATPIPPSADFLAAPVAGSAPLAVSFTDLSTGSPTNWFWSFGDGASALERHPTHTYAAPGVYDVTLVASNPAGSSTKLRVGLVAVAPTPAIQTFLPSADARVKSSSPTGNYGTDPELRVRAGDPTHRAYLRFNVTGVLGSPVASAKLRLFAEDGSSNGGALYEVASEWGETEITWINAPPVGGAPVAGPAAIGAGLWREIDVTSVVQADGSYAFALDSSSTNSVYYSSREGTNPPQLVVETRAPAPPIADFGGAPLAGDAPLLAAFTDLSSHGPTSWLWDFGDGATSTEQHPSHSYTTPGVYDVSLTATNADGSHTLMRSALVAVSAAPLPPVADFSAAPLAGDAPLLAAFTDLSSHGPTSWLWDFGDGATSTEQHPSHSYTTPGVYDVSLTATNADGSHTLMRSALVAVAAAPLPPVADFSAAPLAGDAPLLVAFTDLSSHGPTSWLWDFGDGATSTEQHPSHSYTTPGVYDVSLTATNADGSHTLMRSALVAVAAAPLPPVADFSAAPLAGDAPLLAAFTDLSSHGPTSWLWDFGDGATSTEQHPSHSYTTPGVYDVSLTATNADGSHTLMRSALVAVAAAPLPPVADFSAAPLAGDAPLLAAFTDLSSHGPTSWLWDFGDGATSTEQHPSHSYTTPGVYDVSLTATNADGSHTLMRSALVAVAAAPLPPVADFSAAPLAGDAPLLAAFTDLSSHGPTSWLWDFGDGATSTEQHPSHSYTTPGVYDVSLTATNADGSHTLMRPALVAVAAAPLPPVADFSAAPLAGDAPLLVAFTDLSSHGPTSWLWDFGDGATSTEQHPSHTYAAPGVYDVSLTATNADGSSIQVRSGYVSIAQGVSTLTLAPTADAKVGAAKPTRNYGTAQDLWVKTGAWRSFLRFDVAGLGGPVLGATLRLFVAEGSSNGGALYEASDAWSEGSLTWNTAPPLLGATIASLGPVATGTWVEIDVTGVVVADGSYSFGLESSSTNLAYYGSRESANAPQLVLEVAE